MLVEDLKDDILSHHFLLSMGSKCMVEDDVVYESIDNEWVEFELNKDTRIVRLITDHKINIKHLIDHTIEASQHHLKPPSYGNTTEEVVAKIVIRLFFGDEVKEINYVS